MRLSDISGLTCGLMLVMTSIFSSCNRPDRKYGSEIIIDGSSTVFPLSQAAAEDFFKLNPGTRIMIGMSGTLGGFSRFLAGQTDINNASRPILPSEAAACKKRGIQYFAIPVCSDEIAVLVNKANNWTDYLTPAELHKIWNPLSQGKIIYWDQIRASFPHKPIHLYSPGPASGTFAYFTEVVNGKAGLVREDVNLSFDPDRLVRNISSDPLGLAYFGYVYYQKNRNSLTKVPIHNPPASGVSGETSTGMPGGRFANVPGGTADRVEASDTFGTNPLLRTLYLYVNRESLVRPEMRRFISYYLSVLPDLIKENGYRPLSSLVLLRESRNPALISVVPPVIGPDTSLGKAGPSLLIRK